MTSNGGQDLRRLGEYISDSRKRHYGTVSAAVAAAGVNTMTWNKAERGEPIRADRLTAIEKALGWNIGDGRIVAEGGEPMSKVTDSLAQLRQFSDEALLAELARRLHARGGT